jgi:hypothetical protein
MEVDGLGSDSGLSAVVAAGPFCIADDLAYDPLHEMLQELKANPPHMLVSSRMRSNWVYCIPLKHFTAYHSCTCSRCWLLWASSCACSFTVGGVPSGLLAHAMPCCPVSECSACVP